MFGQYSYQVNLTKSRPISLTLAIHSGISKVGRLWWPLHVSIDIQMAWNRVLPNPGGMNHGNQVGASEQLDKRARNDFPQSYGHLASFTSSFSDSKSKPRDAQQDSRHEICADPRKGNLQSELTTSMVNANNHLDLVTASPAPAHIGKLPCSSSPFGHASPGKSALDETTFCLCRREPRIRRPRNGE